MDFRIHARVESAKYCRCCKAPLPLSGGAILSSDSHGQALTKPNDISTVLSLPGMALILLLTLGYLHRALLHLQYIQRCPPLTVLLLQILAECLFLVNFVTSRCEARRREAESC